jgi:hypothetical protein
MPNTMCVKNIQRLITVNNAGINVMILLNTNIVVIEQKNNIGFQGKC